MMELGRFTRIAATLTATVVALAVCPRAGAGKPSPRAAAEAVSAEKLHRHTVVLGSDALEGRAPGTAGGSRAAAYVAGELERSGVQPLGDEGTFFQQVPLHGNTPLPDSRLSLTSLGETQTLILGEDYLLYTTGSQTWIPHPVPMVFVGYGIVAPEFDHNDYADVDVHGKVVVYLAGEPVSEDPDYFAGTEPTVYSSAETKTRIALSRGAVGSVMIPVTDDADGLWDRLRNEFAFEHLTLAYAVPRHLSIILHPRHAAQLFAEALYDFDAVLAMHAGHTLRAFHLPVQLGFEGSFRSRNFLAPNVVGWLGGGNSRMADRYLVISAHYDHLGIGPAVGDDAIYNGVVDNALGVACVLELARVLSQVTGPPERSVIFLLTTAEEEGNLGATFFLDHSPVPHPRIVANINVDGLATLDTFDDVVGIGGDLSDLGQILNRAVKPLGLHTSRPEEMVLGHEAYARSDQVAFAEAGIPAILVVEGLQWRNTSREDAVRDLTRWFDQVYHTPKDDVEQPLQFDACRQHCAAIAAFALAVADAPSDPAWFPGTPYAYQRLLSLADEHR